MDVIDKGDVEIVEALLSARANPNITVRNYKIKENRVLFLLNWCKVYMEIIYLKYNYRLLIISKYFPCRQYYNLLELPVMCVCVWLVLLLYGTSKVN